MFVIHPDGSNARQLTRAPGFRNRHPASSPDGQTIAFDSTRSGNFELYACATRGTVFADQIDMWEHDDVICALAGNDNVKAGAGDDRGGRRPGQRRPIGGLGDDKLIGGSGNDILIGGPGYTLNCGPGRDTATVDKRDHVSRSCEIVKR